MVSKIAIIKTASLIIASSAQFPSFAQTITGKVIDEKSTVITGAMVQLVNAGISAASSSDGTWSIMVPVSVESAMRIRTGR